MRGGLSGGRLFVNQRTSGYYAGDWSPLRLGTARAPHQTKSHGGYATSRHGAIELT